jgi:DNA-binding NtrC family response regulator
MLVSKTLLITSDSSIAQTVQSLISSINNLRLEVLAGINEVESRLESSEVGIILVHLSHTSDAGMVTGLLRTIASARRPVPLLVLSDEYHAEQALALLRLGAVDYLSRPLDMRRLSYLLDVLTVRARFMGLTARPSAEAPRESPPIQSLGEGVPFLYYPYADMGRMMDQVRTVAPQDTTVLLSGETGTGKTHMARLIHELSPRREAPFLVINCGALSGELIESEMFGHVRGSFTGADRDRVGKFSEVGRGTLLLDEIDAIPIHLQAKLLRAVEERVFEPVGSNRSQTVRARLIAASNKSLDQEAAAGRFRSDLYYRLNVVGFTIPPLRHRPSIIAPLANQYIGEFSSRNGRDVRGLSAETLRILESYSWPGNVRELRNVVERAVALCPGPEIELDDLPIALRSHASVSQSTETSQFTEPDDTFLDAARSARLPSTLIATKEEAEMTRISQALEKHGNNRLRAAAELGISRMTLYKKLRKYNLFGSG